MNLYRGIKEIQLKFKYGFHLRKPLLMARVIANYYKTIFCKKKPLQYVDIVVNFSCNLKCLHCSQTKLEKPKTARRLTLADYKLLAQECIKLGVIHFSFQGGEVFLYPELEEVIKNFQPKKSLISITTNGTLLNKDKIVRLKRIGVDILNISLDSAIAQEHDNFRGIKGTFARAMEALELALNNGLLVKINTTITHQNLHSPGIQKLLDFAIKKKIILNPILAAPVGKWSNNWENLVTEDDTEFINDLHEKTPYVRRDVHANYLGYGCPAIKEVLYITPYGDVLPCPFLHFSLGNILEDSLEEIRERGLKLKIFAEYHPKCLAAEDKEFLRKYLCIISDKDVLPVDLKDIILDLNGDCKHR